MRSIRSSVIVISGRARDVDNVLSVKDPVDILKRMVDRILVTKKLGFDMPRPQVLG